MSTTNINNIKTINTIIKDLSISPQKKLYIYLDSKPACITGLKGVKDAAHEMINENNNNYKYYLYDIKDMFLAPNNNTQKDNMAKINKDYIPQQIRLNKELKNIFTDDFKTI